MESYAAAWNAPSHEECVELLAKAWAGEGEFVNPALEVPLVGIEALATYIAETNEQFAGHLTVPVGEMVAHNSYALGAWRYVGPDGLTTVEGWTFMEFGESGLIRRVVQFFPVTLGADT